LPPTLTVYPGAELPKPLIFALVPESLAAIQEDGEWRGRLTVCSCGFAGCFSQYAWVRQSVARKRVRPEKGSGARKVELRALCPISWG
jgi:hypothetical protein